MGYHLNRLDELVFMAGPKPMRTEIGVHPRLESCVTLRHMLRQPYRQAALSPGPSNLIESGVGLKPPSRNSDASNFGQA